MLGEKAAWGCSLPPTARPASQSRGLPAGRHLLSGAHSANSCCVCARVLTRAGVCRAGPGWLRLGLPLNGILGLSSVNFRLRNC